MRERIQILNRYRIQVGTGTFLKQAYRYYVHVCFKQYWIGEISVQLERLYDVVLGEHVPDVVSIHIYRKNTVQTFNQIPFGDIRNMIEELGKTKKVELYQNVRNGNREYTAGPYRLTNHLKKELIKKLEGLL